MKFWNTLFSATSDNRSLLPRLIVGLVFLSEGIQKFLFPELVGAGRFAAFVATFEIVCGVLVIIGLLTRLASIPLLIIMATALVTTKIPILLDKGFWSMAHEYRTDFAMTMLLIYLIIYGAGKLSFDYTFKKTDRL